MLISGEEEVGFLYEHPSSDGSEPDQFKLAVIDLKQITEDPSQVKQQMQECGTLLEKMSKNCRELVEIPRGGKIETFLHKQNAGEVATTSRGYVKPIQLPKFFSRNGQKFITFSIYPEDGRGAPSLYLAQR